MSDNDGGNSDGVPTVEIIVDDVERIDSMIREEEIISKNETAAPLISMANAGTAASLFGGQTRKRKQTSFYVSER